MRHTASFPANPAEHLAATLHGSGGPARRRGQGAAGAHALRDRVDARRAGPPSALVALVGRGRPHRDGDVAVVPLTSLGP
ncbi:MAG: hypothetical protein F4017_09285 [Acidimicrobiaceae bacterium]|nr:hypothetical protein [Acidimicrobiaceae bacterium]MYK74766.1 hypothetical protein [Acidimicrobiaceae bacterium]